VEDKCREMRRELDRQAKRQIIQPVGMQELLDQIEMANEVKDTLCHDIALRTEELATAKLEYAQVQAEKEELGGRLHRAEEKRQRYAVQMTKLEVQLADSQNSHAEMEEEKANVFKAVMGEQEARIRELEAQLTDVKKSTSKRSGWPF